jgi:hypothetical protein
MVSDRHGISNRHTHTVRVALDQNRKDTIMFASATMEAAVISDVLEIFLASESLRTH